MSKGIVQEIAYAPGITPEPFALEKEAINASKTAFCRKVVLTTRPNFEDFFKFGSTCDKSSAPWFFFREHDFFGELGYLFYFTVFKVCYFI